LRAISRAVKWGASGSRTGTSMPAARRRRSSASVSAASVRERFQHGDPVVRGVMRELAALADATRLPALAVAYREADYACVALGGD
jgi:hypothetical protein